MRFHSSRRQRGLPFSAMPDRDRFLEKLRASLDDGTFVKLTLSEPAAEALPTRNLYARLVELREGPRLSCVWHYATRDVTKNLPTAEGGSRASANLLGADFERAHLFTTTGDWQLRCDRRRGQTEGQPPGLRRGAAAGARSRKSARAARGQRCAFLRALGVTNAAGRGASRHGGQAAADPALRGTARASARRLAAARAARTARARYGRGQGLPDVCDARRFSATAASGAK